MTYTTTYEWSFRIPEEHDDMRDFEELNVVFGMDKMNRYCSYCGAKMEGEEE